MFNLKSALKSSLTLILICATLLLSMPLSSSAAMTTGEITEAMTALKNSVYPQNNYWCGGDPSLSLTYSGCGRAGSCTCNIFAYSSQCHGFALYLAQKLTGSYPQGTLSSYTHGKVSGSWTCYTKTALGTSVLCSLGLQPGDVIRAASDSSYSNGHTAIVWKVEDGKVYFAESWGSVYCKINWGGFNYASYSMSAICSKYEYVALWRNSDVLNLSGCSHNYEEKHDTDHPHRIYKECSKCKEKEYTGTYYSNPECLCCLGQHDYSLGFEEAHPHYEVKTCSLCNTVIYTGEIKKDYSCPICLGIPYDFKIDLSLENATVGQNISVDFSAQNAVEYTVSLAMGNKLIETVTTRENTAEFTLPSVGDYTVNVHASADNGKSNFANSKRITVTAPIISVEEKNGVYTLEYGIALSEEDAKAFIAQRGLTLVEYTPEAVKASFKTENNIRDIYNEDLYTYYPVSLSYYEIIDFCALVGEEMAYINSEKINSVISKLCTKANSSGVILYANDLEAEGSWVYGANNTALSYKNWHETYTGEENTAKNYLFMYPDGTWTDTEAMPAFDHGFVTLKAPEFGYTENDDGTLTLTTIPVKQGTCIKLPSQINGKKVTAIADLCLAHTVYEKVIIPETITKISDNAFLFAEIELFAIPRDWPLESYFSDADIIYVYTMPFTDVNEGEWYYNSLYYCYSNFYISGTSKTTLSPSMTCTREMFVTVLARVMKADTSGYGETSSFSDVLPDQWYSAAIEWAFANDITEGIGDGMFGLGESVTREQIAVFLSNLHDIGEQTEDLSRFTDADEVSDWALNGMRWAISQKVLNGTSKTTLDPQRTAMRSELCQMIYNYCSVFAK